MGFPVDFLKTDTTVFLISFFLKFVYHPTLQNIITNYRILTGKQKRTNEKFTVPNSTSKL